MANMVCLALYLLLALVWILLLLISAGRYGELIEPLDIKQHPLKGLYCVGFLLLDLVHYSYESPRDVKRMAQTEIVYGQRFGGYYYQVNLAEKLTYISLCLVLAPLFGAVLGSPVMSLAGLFAAGVAWYASDSRISDVMKRREREIIRDLPDMVSKMALLINAGMITREAWAEVAGTGESVLYQEMTNTVLEMQNGTPEVEAYINFGTRCAEQSIKKFVSMLVQNLTKGNKELVNFLKSETVIFWEEKKHLVRRQGEEANNKMMLPLGMMLIGVFIMILVPVVSKMGA